MIKLIENISKVKYTIDASQYRYGKLCVKISELLRNKNNFTSQGQSLNTVEVQNLYKVQLSKQNKLHNTTFFKHSGYIGGVTINNLNYYFEKKMLDTCIRRSIWRMMNRTRHAKRLTIRNIKFT